MIRLDNISVKFNPRTVDEVYALTHVSLVIKEGEFVTVIGTNGSGKSTLLNVVAGNIIPDEVFSSASKGRIKMLSKSGVIFIFVIKIINQSIN